MFPSIKLSVDPGSGIRRRHHAHPGAVNRSVVAAARAAGTSSDGGYGLGQRERCRGCSPARPLIAVSCLFVVGAFVAMCAGVLSFPQR